ncbi:hypothetical protein BJS_02340 [Bradyrhizobium japonicum SEMIA 5079]|nr:hypothetical protein BJS_02340 [Bradyrhizobium japonicum SEMIA 5079]
MRSINILAGISRASAAAWPDQSGVKSVLPFCSAAARSGCSSPMGNGKPGATSVDAVMYLERAAFVTGEIMHVDGGASAGHW